MRKKRINRRSFVFNSTMGLAGLSLPSFSPTSQGSKKKYKTEDYQDGNLPTIKIFNQEVEKLPDEKPYAYHEQLLSEYQHTWQRDNEAQPNRNELIIDDNGWKLVYATPKTKGLKTALEDLEKFLRKSMGVSVSSIGQTDLKDWKSLKSSIIIGTREQLSDFGQSLREPKDYEIISRDDQVIICGYDEPGAMFGIYNLEAYFNLREAPILYKNRMESRYSLYKIRMVLSWMGWMEFPDQLLSHMVHDGFDGIFVSIYANPNGDRTTATSSTDFYARLLYDNKKQNPDLIHDLISRASHFGIKVYTPIIWQYLGTKESEEGLRDLVRNIVHEFPDIRGFVLLTEGFWYQKWGGGHGADRNYMEEWAKNWSKAVAVVAEECHQLNPNIEILPWEYNIDFRPQASEIKRYFIKQLPDQTIPLLTWENGKSFAIDGMKGYLRDYSLSQVGPAEVTIAQKEEADKRKMNIYSKVDTFASWQYGTLPYLPCPNQWLERYKALERYGIKGTLESWSSGYKPNFVAKLRAWTCWTNAPAEEELLSLMASKIFGNDQKQKVLRAWTHFSQAIRWVPDTGPSMGTNNAVGNPIFFKEPPLRTYTVKYSWNETGVHANPYWPFTVSRMVFFPDFTNKRNRAEQYARSATGIVVEEDGKILPTFLKYLKKAANEMELGLQLYRQAALASPKSKRKGAIKEVIVAEQMKRMMESEYAILEFENLRLQYESEETASVKRSLLDSMKKVLSEEIERTKLSLLAARKDARLGFQFEQDYVYTPYSLNEKITLLEKTLGEMG